MSPFVACTSCLANPPPSCSSCRQETLFDTSCQMSTSLWSIVLTPSCVLAYCLIAETLKVPVAAQGCPKLGYVSLCRANMLLACQRSCASFMIRISAARRFLELADPHRIVRADHAGSCFLHNRPCALGHVEVRIN